MKIRERLRNHSLHGATSDPDSAEATLADERRLPIARVRSEPSATRANRDGPRPTKTTPRYSSFDRVDAARDDRNERERLRDEARYRRERLELYRARLYGGRAGSEGKLRELQRASDGAAARLRRAEAGAPPTQPPTWGLPRSARDAPVSTLSGARSDGVAGPSSWTFVSSDPASHRVSS